MTFRAEGFPVTAKPVRAAFARCLLPLTLGLATPALADGEFFQADYARGASSVTATLQRDRLTYSLGWSESATGAATSLWTNYGFPVADSTWLRIGPSLRVPEGGEAQWGLRAALERFTTSGRNSLFLLADFNSIQREYLALAQWGDMPSGFAAEVVFQGNASGYREQSVAVSLRLGEGPVRLRGGYRFESNQPFIGLSINTF